MILYPSAADFVATDSHTRHLNDELNDLGVHLEEVPVPEGSPFIGATVDDVENRGEGSLLVVALRRGEELIRKPSPEMLLEAGDRLIVIGHTDSAGKLIRKSACVGQYRGAKIS